MSTGKRPAPEVDVTPELEALLAQFTDDEIETGVMSRGPVVRPDECHSAATIQEILDSLTGDNGSR